MVRTISAEGCARSPQRVAAFRALDTRDLRRGLRADRTNRTLACISRIQHARSPQRFARIYDKSHSRLHFAHSTRTISAEGCARTEQIALSPAFRALDAHDLRRGLRADRTNRTLACISRTCHARSPQRVAFSVNVGRPTLRLEERIYKVGKCFFIRTSPAQVFHTHTCILALGLHWDTCILHTFALGYFALGYLHLHTYPWMRFTLLHWDTYRRVCVQVSVWKRQHSSVSVEMSVFKCKCGSVSVQV